MKASVEFENALSDSGPALLEYEIQNRVESPGDYIRQIINSYKSWKVLPVLDNATEYLDPKDPILGYAHNRPIRNAFLLGVFLGIRVSDYFLPEEAKLKEYKPVLPAIFPEEDPDTAKHRVAEEIVEMADRGYNQAERYKPFFDRWEDTLWRDITTQSYLKRGFGIIFPVMLQGLEAYDLRDLAVMEAEVNDQLNSGIDWDSEFHQATKPEELFFDQQ